MFYSWLADAVLLLHLAFILFVVLGAALVWRYPRLLWLHLATVIWGALIEITGQVCPLTPLENRLRYLSGTTGYHGGFVEHYLLPVLYPHGLTRDLQLILGVGVIVINAVAYAWLHYGIGPHERRP